MHTHARQRDRSKMTSKSKKAVAAVVRHKDGSLWAKGSTVDGVQVGYWEWFRKDGTRLRSGHFDNGQPTGAWTTYDKRGLVYKVTTMKPKARKA
jgi:antitoxin component YwqK of YwqJK toxin-antitoxin module